MRRRHPDLNPTPWRSANDRTRVLIEHHDSTIAVAVGNLLVAEGYEVSTCGGPHDQPHHGCPLAQGGDCDRAVDADVVVFGLNIADEEDRAVLLAWRDRHAEIPVVVELPISRVPLYEDALEGCIVLPRPMTRETLLDAVNQALAPGR